MRNDLGIHRHPDATDLEWRWLAPLGLLLLGFILVPLAHTCRLSCVPGDLGDARFNGVILEHFFRWLSGRESSLISPTFFFPMPGVLTFSDNHWGTGWLYSLLRWMGADRYQAFDLWYMAGYVANFIACHLVLRRFGFSPVASAVGAFAFSFAMPVIARHGHAQLVYRFLVPIALLMWQRFRESGRWFWLGWLALAIVGQFYLSIYLGYFLLLLLSAWALAQWLVERAWPWRWFAAGLRLKQPAALRDLIIALCVAVIALAAMVWLMQPYHQYSKLYGFQRAPDEIASLLPRVRSYLLADGSAIWGGMGARLVAAMPMRHEQQLFFGAGIIGLVLVGLLTSARQLRWVALLSIVVLVTLTLSVRGHSLYLLLSGLPGINSIRAVARIGLVLAMPMALLVAIGVDGARARGSLWGLVAGVLALVMVGESAAMRTVHYDIAQQREAMVALQQQLPRPMQGDAIVYVATVRERPFYETELDGMVLGQLLGIPTLNGYSGNVPPGYGPAAASSPCMQALARLRMAASFFADRLHARLPDAARGTLMVVDHPECTGASWEALPLEELHAVTLRILEVEHQDHHYRVRVFVENRSRYVLDSAPAANPIRLLWQSLQAGGSIDPSAWRPRAEIGQALGRPTLNGDSGNMPPGYEPRPTEPPYVQAALRLQAAQRSPLGTLLAARAIPPTVIGLAACPSASTSTIPLSDASKLVIEITSHERVGKTVRVHVRVANGSDASLNAAAGMPEPVRLSWQIVDINGAADPEGWKPRVDLVGPAILGPGESRDVAIDLAYIGVGDERVLVSAVLEGGAWLHEHGLVMADEVFDVASLRSH